MKFYSCNNRSYIIIAKYYTYFASADNSIKILEQDVKVLQCHLLARDLRDNTLRDVNHASVWATFETFTTLQMITGPNNVQ